MLVVTWDSGGSSDDPLPSVTACFSLSFLQVAAIGPTTAEALVNAGIQVDASANKPNSESLVQAIRQAGQT